MPSAGSGGPPIVRDILKVVARARLKAGSQYDSSSRLLKA